ncbi:MAG: S-layer homology domain-containing protein [Oscillospiraceae bacterium]|nr:S-layer homology domain-containing protein [Oscillospiraceae bacterium]
MKWFFEPRQQADIKTYASAAATSERPANRRGKHRTGRLRAILAGVIAVCCFVGISVPAMALTFSDVSSSNYPWAIEAVDYVSNNGYMNGTGSGLFSPSWDMSRAQIITILYAIAGKPTPPASQYNDVTSSDYFAAAAKWIRSNGIGSILTSTNYLSPSTVVTRLEIAQILWKFAQVMNWTTNAVPSVVITYSDTGSLPPAQLNAVKWCKAYSIMNGVSGTEFGPGTYVNRAQMAVMIKALTDRSSGMFLSNTTSVRKGMDNSYINRYSSTSDISAASSVIAGKFTLIAPPFKRMWNITLTHSSYWRVTDIFAETAIGTHSTNFFCDTLGEGSDHYTHHFSIYHNFDDVLAKGKGAADITVVVFGFPACGAGGLTQGAANNASKWLSVVQSPNNQLSGFTGYTQTWVNRAIQHEMSHLWGAPDSNDTNGICPTACIMKGSFNSEPNFEQTTIWCKRCTAAFAPNQAAH